MKEILPTIHSTSTKTNPYARSLSGLVAALTISVLQACSPGSPPKNQSQTDTPSSEVDIAYQKHQEFRKLAEAMKADYGINIRVPDSSDYLVISKSIHEAPGSPDQGELVPITKLDSARLDVLISYIGNIRKILDILPPDTRRIVNSINFIQSIDKKGAGGLAKPQEYQEGAMRHLARKTHSWLDSIILPLSVDKELLTDQREQTEIFAHEFVHILASPDDEIPLWLQKEGQTQYIGDRPVGHLRTYGLTNPAEDIASIGGEYLLSFVMGTGGDPSLIRDDVVFSKKIMLLTGCFFDRSKGKFTRDLVKEDYQKMFGLTLSESPYFARIREAAKKDDWGKKTGLSYDYSFWNQKIFGNTNPSDMDR